MAEENYMDRFSNPEEFIRQQILAKGNFSSLDKKEMYRLIRVYNIEFHKVFVLTLPWILDYFYQKKA